MSLRCPLSCLALLFLTHCEFLHRNSIGLFDEETPPAASEPFTSTSAEAHATPESQVQGKAAPQGPSSEGVLVTWRAEDLAVDGFILYQGERPDGLVPVKKVALAEVERIEHPQHGPVYRYRLEGVPRERTIYLSIASYRASEESPRGEIFAVVPRSDSGTAQTN